MRVLHIQKAAGVAGSERHLLALLPRLAERGMDVRMCVLRSAGAEAFQRTLEARGVDTVSLPAGPDLNPLLVGRIAAEIRGYVPDIVHTHLIHADLHGQLAARLRRVPGVSSVHGTHAFYRRQPYRSAARVAGHCARRTIAISEYAASFVREQGLSPVDRVRVIPHGVEPSTWMISEDERVEVRGSLGLSSGEIAVGVAARLVPGKGHDFLLAAVGKAVREATNLRLLVAGDGPIRASLEQDARRLLPEGVARFLGFVEDMPRFMAACDVVVFPTLPALSEGFGLAALEAMAAGRPVVATDIASLPEIVVHGETGFLVQPGEVADFAATLQVLSADESLRSRLGAAARARASTEFSLDAMVERTLGVYEALA